MSRVGLGWVGVSLLEGGRGGDGLEERVELAGDVALQTPHDLGLGELGAWLTMRVRTMVHSAEFAWRSPPRLSRWRLVLPEEAWTGVEPQRAAKDFSWPSQPGLSPAVTRSWPAVA
jgi:hypothetical protein